jgi:hypothetical protein
MYFVKLIYGLAFVPPDQVAEMFDTVVMDYLDNYRQEVGFVELAEELEDFVSYIQRTWIGLVAGRNKTRRQPLVPCVLLEQVPGRPLRSADHEQHL